MGRAFGQWRGQGVLLGRLAAAVALPILLVAAPSATGVAVADSRGGESVASAGESADTGATVSSPSPRGPARAERNRARTSPHAATDPVVPQLPEPPLTDVAIPAPPVAASSDPDAPGAAVALTEPEPSADPPAVTAARTPNVPNTEGAASVADSPTTTTPANTTTEATTAVAIGAETDGGTPRRRGLTALTAPPAETPTQPARATVAILDLSAPASPQPAAAAEPTAAQVVAPPVASWLPVVEAGAVKAGAEHRAIQPRLISRPPILTAVVARITSVVDGMLDRLSALPASPINEFLSGALLLVRRALQPPPGSPAPFGVGATKLTVRNETPQSFELWAYYDGSTDNAKVQVAALQPGQEWSNTAYNAVSFDHNLEIVVNGVPKARMVATNSWARSGNWGPWMRFFAPTTGYTGQPATKYTPFDARPPADWDAANLVGLVEGFKIGQSAWISFPNYPDEGVTELNVWVWRGPDIDSGKWWVANTKQFVVAVKQIPGPSQVYNHNYDPILDRLNGTVLPHDKVTWYYFDPNAARA